MKKTVVEAPQKGDWEVALVRDGGLLWDIDIMTNNQPEPIDKLLELADQLSAEERSREPAEAPPGK